MAENCEQDDLSDPASGYKDQPLSTRMRFGLTIDRHHSNHMAYILDKVMEATKSKDYSTLLSDSAIRYRISRDLLWQTKRQANARLAGKINVHKQMIEIWKFVMMDMLGDVQPTAKDWKVLTEKDDKQARRMREYYPHVVSELNGMVYLSVRRQDGTVTTIPLKSVRGRTKDGRIQALTSPYSSRDARPGRFDLRAFADEGYIKRQRAFWEDAMKILSKWMGDGNKIRKDGEWLVHHIVNNDVAMHVIFDNLSVECESRWFKELSDETKYEVAGRHSARHGIPCNECETMAVLREVRNRTFEFTSSLVGARVWIGGKEAFPGWLETLRWLDMNYMELSLREISAYGYMPSPEQMIKYTPRPLTEEGARKAVDELAAFTSDFAKKIPENLQRYGIGQDRMNDRMRDLILEAIAELEMSCSDCDGQLIIKAFVRRRHDFGDS